MLIVTSVSGQKNNSENIIPEPHAINKMHVNNLGSKFFEDRLLIINV